MSASARGIAVFDLDGTVARGDTFKAYLRFCISRRPGCWYRLLCLAGAIALFAIGRRDNTWVKCTLMAATFGGRPWGALARQTEAFIGVLLRHGIRRDALAAMADHRAAGRRLVLATANRISTSCRWHSVLASTTSCARALHAPPMGVFRANWKAAIATGERSWSACWRGALPPGSLGQCGSIRITTPICPCWPRPMSHSPSVRRAVCAPPRPHTEFTLWNGSNANRRKTDA